VRGESKQVYIQMKIKTKAIMIQLINSTNDPHPQIRFEKNKNKTAMLNKKECGHFTTVGYIFSPTKRNATQRQSYDATRRLAIRHPFLHTNTVCNKNT
jgi:hypothetical protein